MNEIVKYHNDLSNQITIKTLNGYQLNIFMGLCAKMRDKNIEKIIFTFNELKELIKWENKNDVFFIKTLEETNKKLIRLNFRFEDEREIVQFVLFPTFRINKIQKILTIAVNKDFAFLLNNLTKNFTRFELENFTNLTSKYSKYLYKELMKFKSTGYCVFSIDDFRDKLDIPTTYRITDINKRVLNVIEKELSKIFKEFEINKVKKGRNIDKIEFYFSIQKENVLIIDDKKERTEQDLLKDFFKANLKGIIYNSKIEKALLKRLKKDKLAMIEKYLLKQYEEIKKLDYIKDKNAFFSNCIIEDKRILSKDENQIIKAKENKKLIDTLEKFQKLDYYDKLKIEETAVKLYVERNNVDINYLLTMKDTNEDIYYSVIKQELEKSYNRYLKEKKENISFRSNNGNSNGENFDLDEVKSIMINDNKLDLINISDAIKSKIIDDVENKLKDSKDKILFRVCKEKELETLIEIFSDEFVESFNKFHHKNNFF